eukprot:CAMPEP_0116848204 /NCGR_PEP_ID=MMETSP0418-20121206/14862_1 /TAXON_ID=1158023 /ORGANISM="Astrosyne radiata, Strain 13vi08-1A" /LENGTH=190 /DNA_ID=CAMNT_0004479739 /DNA_START=149 /DNA_END=721 /DNA_ORIENTATION=+
MLHSSSKRRFGGLLETISTSLLDKKSHARQQRLDASLDIVFSVLRDVGVSKASLDALARDRRNRQYHDVLCIAQRYAECRGTSSSSSFVLLQAWQELCRFQQARVRKSWMWLLQLKRNRDGGRRHHESNDDDDEDTFKIPMYTDAIKDANQQHALQSEELARYELALYRIQKSCQNIIRQDSPQKRSHSI